MYGKIGPSLDHGIRDLGLGLRQSAKKAFAIVAFERTLWIGDALCGLDKSDLKNTLSPSRGQSHQKSLEVAEDNRKVQIEYIQ